MENVKISQYTSPELEIIALDLSDIVTTLGESDESGSGVGEQMTMYNVIVSCVQEQILTCDRIAGVIPNKTAIQNLRTSSFGDTLTRDVYHLSPLEEEDREYLTSLGLNPDEYKVLEPTYTLCGYYNSSASSKMSTSDTDLNKQFYCTNKLFSRYGLTIGSVIRLTSGYRYRPEGWVAFD